MRKQASAAGALILAWTGLVSIAPQAESALGLQEQANVDVDHSDSDDPTDVATAPSVSSDVALDEFSRTTQQADGSYSADIYETPINFLNDESEWEPIQNQLVPSDSQTYLVENRANSYELKIPENPRTNPIRFATGDDWIQFLLDGSTSTVAVQHTQAIIDLDSASDADRVLIRSASDGVKETIVVDEQPTSTSDLSFIYHISASPGVTAQLADEGHIVFENAGQEVVGVIPPPIMWDSSVQSQATSNGMRFNLDATANGWTLELNIDSAWLLNPARVFPVYIDPTLNNQPAQYDCWIRETTPTTSYCGSTTNYIRAGRAGAGQRYRGLLRFDVSSIPPSANITSATAWLYLNPNESSTTQSTEISMFDPGKQFDNTATWQSSGALGSWNGGSPGSTAYGTKTLSGAGGDPGYKYFPSLAPLVKNWIRDSDLNKGLVLKFNTDQAVNVMAFHSSSPATTNNGKRPFLNVSFTNDPDDSFEPAADPVSTQYPGVDNYELEDLTTIANEEGISVGTAVNRYAWHDDFAEDIAPIVTIDSSFAEAAITGDRTATVKFKGDAPQISQTGFSDLTAAGVSVTVQGGEIYSANDVSAITDLAIQSLKQKYGEVPYMTRFNRDTGILEVEAAVATSQQGTGSEYRTAARGTIENERSDLTTPDVQVTLTDGGSPLQMTSLLGGVKIARVSLLNGDRECTSGFPAKWINRPGTLPGPDYDPTNPPFRSGIITARHCNNGTNTYGYKSDHEREALEDATFFVSKDEGDIQFHPRSTDEQAAPYFYSNIGKLRPLTGYTSPEVTNRKVCLFGRTTKARKCGRVTSYNQSGGAYDADGVLFEFENLVAVANSSKTKMTEGGDSGGPAYFRSTASGLITGNRCFPGGCGADGNCRRGPVSECTYEAMVTPLSGMLGFHDTYEERVDLYFK